MTTPLRWEDEMVADLIRIARRHQVFQGLTLAGCERLPYALGMRPRRVKVFDVTPGVVTIFVHRKWWQRLIPRHKRKWAEILRREYEDRRAVGIQMEVYIR